MLKTIFSSIRQFKISSALNILGLSIAITVAYTLCTYLYFYFTFNNKIPDADRIFYVQTRGVYENETWNDVITPEAYEYLIAHTPCIEGCQYHTTEAITNQQYIFEGASRTFWIKTLYSTPSTIDIFGIELIDGSWEPVFDYDEIAISEQAAKKYNLQIGSLVCHDGEMIPEYDLATAKKIAAIYRVPQNSDINNYEFIRKNKGIPFYLYGKQGLFLCVKLHNKNDKKQFEIAFMEYLHTLKNDEKYETYKNITTDNINDYIRLIPLNKSIFVYRELDVYDPSTDSIYITRMDRKLIYTYISIIVVILAVAFINYFNIFVALLPRRIRSINTKKILGSETASLRCEIIGESVFLTAIAIVISALAVISLSDFDWYNEYHIGTFGDKITVFGIISFVSITIAILTALYPAWYVTSFQPAFTLKGTFAANRSGKMLRNILLAFQLICSFVLIALTIGMYNQYDKNIKHKAGYNRENLYIQEIPFGENRITVLPARNDFKTSLTTHPDILDVAFSEFFYGKYGIQYQEYETANNSEPLRMPTIRVDNYFFDTMEIEIIEGCNFDERNNCAIIDECAHKMYAIGVGDILTTKYRQSEVVGICKKTELGVQTHTYNEPKVFINDNTKLSELTIRATATANLGDIQKHISDCIQKFDATLDGETIDSIDNMKIKTYSYIKDISSTFAMTSSLSVVILLMGVFGVVFFETQHRRKEISIRRVNGATCGNILLMFSYKFTKIIILCYVIALPLSVFILDYWLSAFRYKAPVQPWIFIVSFLSVSLLTLAVVTASAWNIANTNPIKILKKGE